MAIRDGNLPLVHENHRKELDGTELRRLPHVLHLRQHAAIWRLDNLCHVHCRWSETVLRCSGMQQYHMQEG